VIGDVLAELMARRGFGRIAGNHALAEAWQQAAGEMLARHTRPAAVKRGVLEVIAANSTIMQELSFHKQPLLAELARLLPEQSITNLRFRVGPVA
jgi:predicted nucleic acid-binding Zn ribbon protein